MIEDLIKKVFADRHAAHLAHWATDSYSEHMALGSFYDDVVGQIDTIVEVYQGRFGKIKSVTSDVTTPTDITKQLRATMTWFTANKEKIAKGSGAVNNEIDALEGIYAQTLYKLENLS